MVVLATRDGGDSDDSARFGSASDGQSAAADGSTSITPTAEPDVEAEPTGVPQVDCEPLLTYDEVIEALGGSDDGPSGLFEVSRGETCIETSGDDDAYFIVIGPGSPADFITGAQLIGVPAQPVDDVGHEANWFGGASAEGGGDVGVLSVRAGTELGVLHFRITVGRPDLDSEAQLAIAETLANNALRRFPGIQVLEPEPIEISLDRDPVDLSDLSFADNLLVKEEEGAWTRGEGLVATLRLFAGEADASEVLRHTELADTSDVEIAGMAREYLESTPEDDTAAEISRLLDVLFLSRQKIDEISAALAPPETAPAGEPAPAEEGATGSGSEQTAVRFMATRRLAQEDQQEEPEPPCPSWFGIGCWGEGSVVALDDKFGPGKYRLFHPDPDRGDPAGWSNDHIIAALEAMEKAATLYETLGTMPIVELTFTPFDDVDAQTDFDTGDCSVNLNTPLQAIPIEHFKQQIAAHMAICLISQTFENPASWWKRALAVHLSGVVYPQANAEHEVLPGILASRELPTSMLQRRASNWAFFEHLHPTLDTPGVIQFVAALPPLDAAAGIEETFHSFAQKLTDNELADVGGGVVPIDTEADSASLASGTTITANPSPFRVARVRLNVAAGKKACASYIRRGTVTANWREGFLFNSASDWKDPPAELTGDSVLLVTSTKGGLFQLKVTKVVDEDKDCEEQEIEPGSCNLEVFCDDSGYYFAVPGYGVFQIAAG